MHDASYLPKPLSIFEQAYCGLVWVWLASQGNIACARTPMDRTIRLHYWGHHILVFRIVLPVVRSLSSWPTSVDIYYYLSGHIALYLDANMWFTFQSHFWFRAGTYQEPGCVWAYRKTLPVHAHPDPYITAIRIEVITSLYWDSAACDPILYPYTNPSVVVLGPTGTYN